MAQTTDHATFEGAVNGWSVAALTDLGRNRTLNEDVLVVRPDLGLLAVFDGVHDRGVAAVQAASTVESELAARPVAAGEGAERLRSALLAANARLFDAKSMGGATVVAGLLGSDGVSLAYVGDCRAYLHDHGSLRRLTRDHSLVAEQLGAGVITPEEARNSFFKRVVTRALWGGIREVEVEACEVQVRPSVTLLLCSDGVHSQLSDQAIAQIVGTEGDLTRACQALFAAANQSGSDNVTVVLARRG